MYTIKVDHENNAETWFDAVFETEISTWHPTFRKLDTTGADEVDVTKEEAEALLAWASSFPGWSEGPEYAPHPLIIDEA